MTNFIIQILIGALGGNGAALLLSKYSLGTIGNTIVGILGGAGGGQLLAMLNPQLAQGLGGQIGGAAVGGGILMIIVGIIKNALAKA